MPVLRLGFRTRLFSRTLADILREAQARDIVVRSVAVDRVGWFEKYIYLELLGEVKDLEELDALIDKATKDYH